MDYEIKLQEFEGPLDLLLHLIKKNEIDIFDIPISKITEQYIYYIDQFKEYNMDLSSEFIVMAAQLIQIKSKLLLPLEENENGEEMDPREELAQKIYEYKIFKEISNYMKLREETHLKTYYKDPEYHSFHIEKVTSIDIEQLLGAFKRVLSMKSMDEDVIIHKIERESIRIEDRVKDILFSLKKVETIEFRSLFTLPTTRTNIVVTFLALLELIKNNIVMIKQISTCDEIVISKCKVIIG